MAIFPVVQKIEDIPINNEVNDRGLQILYDFKTKDFPLKNGQFILLDGNASVLFWVEKTLFTEYERSAVYKNTDYGMPLEKHKGKVSNNKLTRIVIENDIKKALMQHERINSISNLKLETEKENVSISFDLELKPLQKNLNKNSISNIEDVQQFYDVKMIDKNNLRFKTILGENLRMENV